MNDFIKEPQIVTFVMMYKCTSTCANCCFQCSPHKGPTLAKEQVQNFLTQICRDFPTIKSVVFTGGECSVLDYLTDLIRIASTRGLNVRIVSNCVWAKTYISAQRKIWEWKKAGLTELNFSTGDEHLNFIPITNIKNAILASVENGYKPFINIESHNNSKFHSRYFFNDNDLSSLLKERKFTIVNGIWVDFKTPENMFNNFSESIFPINQRCENLFDSITISPNSRLKACCGIISCNTKYIDLGNLNLYGIRHLYKKQYSDFLKIWLYTEGPYKILEFVSKYDKSIHIKDFAHLHKCLVCAIILNNEHFLSIIKDHLEEVFSTIILKYKLI